MSLAMSSFCNFEDSSSLYSKLDSSYVTKPQFSMAVTPSRGMAIWSGKMERRFTWTIGQLCVWQSPNSSSGHFCPTLGQASPKFRNEHDYINEIKCFPFGKTLCFQMTSPSDCLLINTNWFIHSFLDYLTSVAGAYFWLCKIIILWTLTLVVSEKHMTKFTLSAFPGMKSFPETFNILS